MSLLTFPQPLEKNHLFLGIFHIFIRLIFANISRSLVMNLLPLNYGFLKEAV
jgi:hypothetical protein